MPGRLLAGLMLGVTLLLAAAPAASAETRTLKLYFLHTRERAEITYKRNGRYIQSGLNEINRFLRDWRRNEPTKMDPQLLDLLWEAYRQSGSRDYIHVVSAYRAPETNAMLRKRSSGVAKKSQHMLGKAIDFYLPDVKLSKLRNIGLRMQVGGVGYYPRSGSPFVHFDVASVRHWPRMSRKELASVFPNGKTLHVPSDGKPLPGYQQAVASYEARKRSGGSIQIANDSGGAKRGKGLLAALFGGGADEEEDNAEAQVASAPRPAQAVQKTREESQPERPATILAALPARQLPVPREAPRPAVDVGTPSPVEAPAADAAPKEDTPIGTEESAPTQVANLDVPVPSSRPGFSQPEAVQVAQADDDAAAAVKTAFATPTRRPDAPEVSSDVIAEILAAQKDQPVDAGTENSGVIPAYLPASAPARSKSEYMLASLPIEPAFGTAEERREEFEPASAKAEKSSASPRLALLSNESGQSPSAVIAGSVKTTKKGPKPGPRDAGPGRKPTVLPARAVIAELALSRQSMFENASQTRRPAFTSEVAEVPKAVYTAGFEKGTPVADAQRFTGRAVTFLSVAKFD